MNKKLRDILATEYKKQDNHILDEKIKKSIKSERFKILYDVISKISTDSVASTLVEYKHNYKIFNSVYDKLTPEEAQLICKKLLLADETTEFEFDSEDFYDELCKELYAEALCLIEEDKSLDNLYYFFIEYSLRDFMFGIEYES